jgi:hypothetical protein
LGKWRLQGSQHQPLWEFEKMMGVISLQFFVFLSHLSTANGVSHSKRIALIMDNNYMHVKHIMSNIWWEFFPSDLSNALPRVLCYNI